MLGHRRPKFLVVACLCVGVLGACGPYASVRNSPSPSVAPASSSTQVGTGAPSASRITLDIVVTGPTDESSVTLADPNSYLDGIRVAARAINAAGGVDGRPIEFALHRDAGDPRSPATIIEGLANSDTTAVLYIGPGEELVPIRLSLAREETPVVLLEGDLYSQQALFRQVFQTTIPWRWQAHTIARYVVRDRRAEDVVFLGAGPEAENAADVFADEMAYWGGSVKESLVNAAGAPGGWSEALKRAASADWVVVFAPPVGSLELVNALEEAAGLDRRSDPSDRPGVTGSADLLAASQKLVHPESGTTACYTYTWAGWAQPIERVHSFIETFERTTGHAPNGLEQEGFDAVSILAEALRTTHGQGGAALVNALENIEDRAFSSFPVTLGPDDHVFLPRSELGLFAVPGEDERLDPWQSRGDGNLWRPVMRTFTYDGKRDDILDRDKRVFFPKWRKNRPSPPYWESRYGITTRSNDPLH